VGINTFFLTGIGRPNGVVAQVVVPQNRYDFALRCRDIRLLWALNCGSISLPSSVFIMTPEHLERQLHVLLRSKSFIHTSYITKETVC
jgi:hypothetical protein